MKKYRLKKDLPTVKAGALFKLGNNELVAVDDNVMPYITQMKYIINFDEWFEEVNEFGEWRPKDGEVYKHLDIIGEVDDDNFLDHNDVDEFRISTGNCYPLDTPDKVIDKEQRLIPQAMHRLKIAAKKAWFEFNGSEGPDWSDIEQGKYYIYFNYSYMTRTYSVVKASLAQTLGCVYFPTKEACQTYVDNNQDDLKLLFGVE